MAPIPTQGRRGRPLVIVDVADAKFMQEAQALEEASDMLPIDCLLVCHVC